jgi:sugar lactone lactonase YvrE
MSTNSLLFLAILIFFFLQPIAADLFLKSIAGYGKFGWSGDNGPATAAQINGYDGLSVWVDTAGNVYIPDLNNNRIRKVDSNEIISTLGGTGVLAASGGSGIISSMSFFKPTCIVGDTASTFFYMSDQRYVWKYTFSDNIIAVIAGTGVNAFSGDGNSASFAQLNIPRGLWLTTSGILYIADTGNWRVRKINSGGTISTVAGSSSSGSGGNGNFATLATLMSPTGVYVDSIGALYIADSNAFNIRRVDPGTFFISVFAGSGSPSTFNGDSVPATWAKIAPHDVKGDSLGNIYIVDTGNCRIRKVDISGIITTFLGNQVCELSVPLSVVPSSLYYPSGLWIDSSINFYITQGSAVGRTFSLNSVPTASPTSSSSSMLLQRVAGFSSTGYSGNNGPATLAQIFSSNSIWGDAIGRLYLCGGNSVIRRVDGLGIIYGVIGSGSQSTAGMSGSVGGVSFLQPYTIVGNVAGTVMYISDLMYVWRYDVPGGIVSVYVGGLGSGFAGDGNPVASSSLSSPAGLWLSPVGELFIADSGNGRIRKVSTGGIINTVAGSGNFTVRFFEEGIPATSANLSPKTLAFDTNGRMFIADSLSARIRLVDTNNIITTFAGNGETSVFNGDNLPATCVTLATPSDVKVDSAGNVYIACQTFNRIHVVNSAGILRTYIGNGMYGTNYALAPLFSRISAPSALWIDSLDSVYFAEVFLIRKTVSSPSAAPSPVPLFSPANLFQRVVGGKCYQTGYDGNNLPATGALMNTQGFW